MSEQAPNGRWTRRPEESNWGDFGPDDQLGRLNLITPAAVRRAAQEVREGLSAGTHIFGPWDPPGRGMGAQRLGIDTMAVKGIQTRAAMVDLHRLCGRERRFIGFEDFMQAMEHDRVEVSSGDILCLYTGFSDVVREMGGHPDPEVLHNACAVLDGRDTRLQQWIANSGVAAIAADNYAVEGLPSKSGAIPCAAPPLHELCLFKLGIPGSHRELAHVQLDALREPCTARFIQQEFTQHAFEVRMRDAHGQRQPHHRAHHPGTSGESPGKLFFHQGAQSSFVRSPGQPAACPSARTGATVRTSLAHACRASFQWVWSP